MDTITLTQDLKDRLLAVIQEYIDEDNGELTLEDKTKLEAVPVGTIAPVNFGEGRDDWLAFYPEDMTGEELFIYLCEYLGMGGMP